jgi:hypothetical protein
MFVFAFALSLSHCSQKNNQADTQEVTPEQLKVADQALGQMINQISNTGFKDRKEITQLLDQFNKAESKIAKYKLCSPIMMASLSYGLRNKLNQDNPQLSKTQQAIVEKAKTHCQWATQTINRFEESLSDEDFKTIAGDIENSLLPYRKSLFSTGKKCSKQEYAKLMALDRKRYTDTKVLGATLIMAAVQVDGNRASYIPRYKQVVEKSEFPEKDFLMDFLDHAAGAKPGSRAIEQKKQSLLRATQAFSAAGVGNIPQFLVQSVSTAPNCFNSVSSGVVDIAKVVTTSDRMKKLHARLMNEIKKTGDLPVMKPVEQFKKLKDIDIKYLDQLVAEKIDTRDRWMRPLMVSGDKTSFQVVSAGQDRKPGTEDDIVYPNSE